MRTSTMVMVYNYFNIYIYLYKYKSINIYTNIDGIFHKTHLCMFKTFNMGP